tara:strand:+ start:1842 stop:3803 length:1962 start_codon:yes stop_codon:yes gene_type:complete
MDNLVNEILKEIIKNSRLVETTAEEAAGVTMEPDTEEKKVIRTPKFRISESWGNPDSIDRGVIRRIAANLETLDVKSMIAYVQEFQQAAGSKEYSVAEILSNLMFLEAFQSLLFDFNASTSGFLFEALLAGVMGGYQIPAEGGTTPADVGGIPVSGASADAIGKQTDEMMEEYRKNPKDGGGTRVGDVSLKLLAVNGEVKGSYHNLVRAFAPEPTDRDPLDKEKPMQPVEKMTYVVVEKVQPEDKNLKELTLNFYEFDITLDNWFDIIGHRSMERGSADIKMVWKREEREWHPGQPNDFDRDENDQPKSLEGKEIKVWPALEGTVVVPEQEEGQEPIVVTTADLAERAGGEEFRVYNIESKKVYLSTRKKPLPAGTYQIQVSKTFYTVAAKLRAALDIKPKDGSGMENLPGNKSQWVIDPNQTYLVSAKVGEAPVAGRTSHFKHLYGDEVDNIESMLTDGTWAEMPKEDKITYLRNMKAYKRKEKSETGGTQFHISSKFHKSLNGGKTLIGTLDISSAKLKNAAEKYADDLGDKVVDIFNALADVIDNINNYFLGEEAQKQKFGADAITNAITLRTTTEQYISEADMGFASAEEEWFAKGQTTGDTAGSRLNLPPEKKSWFQKAKGAIGLEEQKQHSAELDKLIEQMINKSLN